VIALDLLGIGDKLLIDVQEGGLVKDREEGSPFLEVDVDAAVREQTRRNLERLLRSLGAKGLAALDVQESLWVELSAGLASLLDLALELLCRNCQ
jgi:hypothetical protein